MDNDLIEKGIEWVNENSLISSSAKAIPLESPDAVTALDVRQEY